MKAFAMPISKATPAPKVASTRRKLPSFKDNPKAYMQPLGAYEQPDTIAKKAKRTKELAPKTPAITKDVFYGLYDEKLVEQLGPIEGLRIKDEPYLITPPETRLIDPRSLYIDRNYQRKLTALDLRLLEEIGNEFAWDEYKIPNVFEDAANERLFVTDGQKTVLAAIHRHVPLVPVFVITAPQTELLKRQANSFVGINMRRKAIPAQEMFTALLVRGDDRELALAKILRANGIQPVGNRGNAAHGKYNQGETQSISILRNLHKHHGDENFSAICKIMTAARFRPIKREHLNALGAIADKEDVKKIDVDRMANAIRSIVDKYALLEARDISMKSNRHIQIGHALADIYLTRYKQKAKAIENQ